MCRVSITDVSKLAHALGEARRARIALPIAIGGRALLSLSAISTGDGGGPFDIVSVLSLATAAAAAIVLALCDAALIRGREWLGRILRVFIWVAVFATLIDAWHAAHVVFDTVASGRVVGPNTPLAVDEIFVLIFALTSWVVLLIVYRARKALSAPLSVRDKQILATARAMSLAPQIAFRNLVALVLAASFITALALTLHLIQSAHLDEVFAEIRRIGPLTMVHQLFEGVGRGETAAIGVVCLFSVGLLVLAVAIHAALFPHHTLLNLMRRWARDARAALGADARRPILLLRSFTDDALGTPQHPSDLAATVEGAIGWPALGRGPLIAIGMPGEAAPSGRAYRTYLEDAEWQMAVLGWTEQSRLVIVILGRTAGVRWELERLRDENRLEKTLIPAADQRGGPRGAMGATFRVLP